MMNLGAVNKAPGKVRLDRATRLAKKICRDLRPIVEFSMIVGSVRRKRPKVSDIELVVLPGNLGEFLTHVADLGFEGGERIQRGMIDGVKIELYIAHHPDELGSMIFMYTGDKTFEIAMRSIAKRRGLKLDQYGIWSGQDLEDLYFQSPFEEDFFEFLGVEYHTPEERSFKDRPKGYRRKK